jgi:acyl carrier protein phosphodiesterase
MKPWQFALYHRRFRESKFTEVSEHIYDVTTSVIANGLDEFQGVIIKPKWIEQWIEGTREITPEQEEALMGLAERYGIADRLQDEWRKIEEQEEKRKKNAKRN